MFCVLGKVNQKMLTCLHEVNTCTWKMLHLRRDMNVMLTIWAHLEKWGSSFKCLIAWHVTPNRQSYVQHGATFSLPTQLPFLVLSLCIASFFVEFNHVLAMLLKYLICYKIKPYSFNSRAFVFSTCQIIILCVLIHVSCGHLVYFI